MGAAEIVAQVEQEGVRLRLAPSGDSIECVGKRSVVSRLLPLLREHKAEIVDILTRQSSPGPARTWTAGNPYRCACGFMTGWRTDGKPLCPVCATGQDEAYRQRMLSYAAEMEQAAMTMDDEKRAARLAIVVAVRQEFVHG